MGEPRHNQVPERLPKLSLFFSEKENIRGGGFIQMVGALALCTSEPGGKIFSSRMGLL
jgi:hypothetical protein